jgi:putative ABC transport system permease protein
VRLRSANRQQRLAIMGLPSDGRLQRVLDTEGRQFELPAHGLVLTEKLADLLGVRIGDLLWVEVLEGRRPVRQLAVSGIVAGYVGTAAYMQMGSLNEFLQEGGSISGAFLAVDPAARETLYQSLKQTPQVAGVTIKQAAIEAFERTVAENILRMRAINAFFASIIAFGVVYNAARITLAERSRELATMRVLGFSRGDVSYILLGELAILVVAAVPFGLVFGTGLAYIMVSSMETESYTVPLVILPSTYAYAVSVTLVATAISGLLVRRSVDTLDLIGVLKNA